MNKKQLADKLHHLGINYFCYNDKFVVYAEDKPESMTWSMFQFKLKEIARYNQNNQCICGNTLKCCSDLHHALITRGNVKGNKECRHLVHCSLNVIEVCKKCHLSVTKAECAKFLANIFGPQLITDWYNSINDKMVSDLTNIDYYLERIE